LKGLVVDGFDKAIKDVEVKVKGAKSTVKTDENGQYKIAFDTGKIEVSFKKKGHAKQKFNMNIHEASKVPMQKLTLWEFPESGGIFLIRMNDYKKINKIDFFSERDDNSISFYVKGDATKISCQSSSFVEGEVKMMMLDYSKDKPLVVGKTLYEVKDNNFIDRIVFETGTWSPDRVEDQYVKVSNRLGLRYITLKPGKYFYCIGEITMTSKVGYGFLFEIATSDLP
jgi:hypothetical protein